MSWKALRLVLTQECERPPEQAGRVAAMLRTNQPVCSPGFTNTVPPHCQLIQAALEEMIPARVPFDHELHVCQIAG